jgi:hydrogenase maturation protease
MKKELLVAGLGNPLMSDEGIGVHILNRLLQDSDKYPFAEFIDAGTAGINLLHLISNRKKVIIIDCAYMNTGPGTLKRFVPEEAQTVKKLAVQSLHEADILKIIEMSALLGEKPREIIIFGIEPQAVEPGNNISRKLEEKMNFYVSEISKDIRF